MEAIIAFQFLLIAGLFWLILILKSDIEYEQEITLIDDGLIEHLFDRVRALEAKQHNQEVNWQ